MSLLSANITSSSVVGTSTPPPPSWVPSSMPNLWLGVDPSTTISATKWTDGWSGLNNDLIVTSGNITTETLNSKTVVKFNNSPNNTLATAGNFPQGGNAAWSMYIAIKCNSAATDHPICGFGLSGSVLAAAGMYGLGGGNYNISFAGGNDYHPNIPVSTNFILASIIKSPGAINTTLSVRLNGAAVASLGGDSTNTPNVTSTTMKLGQWANLVATSFQGDIGAFFVTTVADALSDTLLMENYINSLFSPTIY